MLKLLCHYYFWRTLDIPLINCEVSLTLTWFRNCIITSKAYREEVGGDTPVDEINNTTNPTFKITDTKLYVPVVTLSAQDDNKLLEQEQDLKEQSNGTNIDQKCLIKVNLTI